MCVLRNIYGSRRKRARSLVSDFFLNLYEIIDRSCLFFSILHRCVSRDFSVRLRVTLAVPVISLPTSVPKERVVHDKHVCHRFVDTFPMHFTRSTSLHFLTQGLLGQSGLGLWCDVCFCVPRVLSVRQWCVSQGSGLQISSL